MTGVQTCALPIFQVEIVFRLEGKKPQGSATVKTLSVEFEPVMRTFSEFPTLTILDLQGYRDQLYNVNHSDK